MRASVAAMVSVLVLFAAAGAAAGIVRSHERGSERDNRDALVRRLEREITAHARAKVATHELDGPVLRTRCLPFEDFDPEDTGVLRGRYSCVAITFQTSQTYNGHTFIGLIDYGSGRIRFYRTGIPSWLGI